MTQLRFDFDALTDEEIAALCSKLVAEAAALWEALIEYNIVFQRLQVGVEAVAGCSLEEWDDATLTAYASLCVEAYS